MTRSPIWWFGGKGKMTRKLLPLIPAHHTYVEPFGGGASLLFAKPPSRVEVYNDLDGGLVNLFRVLRDARKFKRFYRLVQLTPYAREEYDFFRETWQDCEDDVERAYRFFVVARQSFGGRFGASFGTVVTASQRGMAGTCSKWLSCIEGLPQVHARLMRVQIEQQDFRTILERYDTPETFFYCDPPYPHEARAGGEYKHEMALDDHAALVRALLDIEGEAMLSCYWYDVYQPLVDAGWTRKDWDTACHAAGRTRATGIQGNGAATAMQARTETVLMSYERREQMRLKL